MGDRFANGQRFVDLSPEVAARLDAVDESEREDGLITAMLRRADDAEEAWLDSLDPRKANS